MKLGDVFEKAQKRKRTQKIKILDALAQAQLYWSGAYNLKTGDIEIGSTEKETPRVIEHEFMHKLLFEQESLEAGVMWDNIAEGIELFLYKKMRDAPYVYTQPARKPKYIKPKHKTLEEKGLTKEPIQNFGLGITTYKSGEVKNIKTEAWKITQQITKELLPKLKGVNIIQTIPVIGYWKGSKEPSSQIILRGVITPEVREEIITFKKKYNQDAVMLFTFEGKGWIGIELNKIPEDKLNTLGFEALTYDFERQKVFIVGQAVNTVDLRKRVRELGGSLRTFPLGVEFL